MILSDQQREENFQEYLRLRQDPNYYDVTFDDKSGGVSAIHREHRFDSSMGLYGIKKGDYERLEDGWAKFLNDIDSQRYPNTIKQVLCVVVDEVIEWDIPNKKAAEAAF